MCGRFTLRAKFQALADYFGVGTLQPLDLRPRYNVAPTQRVFTLRLDDDGQRQFALLRWGLIPSWAKDEKIGNSLINARAETVATKPSFRSAFVKRRCLVVADGYYEWQKTDAGKQPYLIHRPDDAPFGFAGLWERWGPDKLESCTIITTEASDPLRHLHDRMPIILDPEAWPLWLDPGVEGKAVLQSLLRPSSVPLETRAVSTVVNSPRNDVPECVEAIAL